MANLEELKKNLGQLFRLRPYPFLVDGYRDNVVRLTTSGPRRERIGHDADYDWKLKAVDLNTNTATLVCLATGHEVTLNSDDIREHRKPHRAGSATDGRPALMLKSKLYLEDGFRVQIEPF
jgi:hypothetical protein